MIAKWRGLLAVGVFVALTAGVAVPTQQEHDDLSTRVTALEASAPVNLEPRVDALEIASAAHDSDIATNAGAIVTNATSITSNATGLGAHDVRLTTNEAAIADLLARVTALEGNPPPPPPGSLAAHRENSSMMF